MNRILVIDVETGARAWVYVTAIPHHVFIPTAYGSYVFERIDGVQEDGCQLYLRTPCAASDSTSSRII